MVYIFEFTVVGNGTVKVYKNDVLQYSLRAGEGSKIVQYVVGDIFMHKVYPDPGTRFLKACDQLGTPCETTIFYSHTVNLSWYFYRYVTYQFGTEPSTISISSIAAIISDLSQPQTRTIKVLGTGTGQYQVTENSIVIATRTLLNGLDLFNINNISYGSHVYCTNPSDKCVAFTISQVKWGCFNNCSAPYVGGTYATQAECQAACELPLPLRWDCSGAPNYLCTQTTVLGKYATQAKCQAACKAGGKDDIIWIIAGAAIIAFMLMRKN